MLRMLIVIQVAVLFGLLMAIGTSTVQAQDDRTITATITDSGLRVNADRITADDVIWRFVNNSSRTRTVTVEGPGDFSRRIEVLRGQTRTVTIENIRAGNYLVFVDNNRNTQAWRENVTVNRGRVDDTANVTVTVTGSELRLSRTSIRTEDLVLTLRNTSNVTRTVIIDGPFIDRRVRLSPNETETIRLNNVREGNYRIFVEGLSTRSNWIETLSVNRDGTDDFTTVNITVTGSGLQFGRNRVQAEDLALVVRNTSNTTRTVFVSGPNVNQQVTLSPGETNTIRLSNVREGNYLIYVQGLQDRDAWRGTLVVNRDDGDEARIIRISLFANRTEVSPATVSTDDVIIRVINRTNQNRTFTCLGDTRTLGPGESVDFYLR